MLAVNERGHPVGGLAGLEQKRIAVLAHERIGRDHQADAERTARQLPPRHEHEHAGGEVLGRPARPALVVIDLVDEAMQHAHP